MFIVISMVVFVLVRIVGYSFVMLMIVVIRKIVLSLSVIVMFWLIFVIVFFDSCIICVMLLI